MRLLDLTALFYSMYMI